MVRMASEGLEYSVFAEPASMTLPDLRAGDVYYGEITLTKHGPIRARSIPQTVIERFQ